MPKLPRLYAILDGTTVRSAGLEVLKVAEHLRHAGVQLLQYREKAMEKHELRRAAIAIREVFAGSGALLVLNDFAGVAVDAGWGGVHLGQGDQTVEEARRILGTDLIIGLSTHTPEQFRNGTRTSADYLAYGPIYRTSTKPDAQAPVGLEGLRTVRPMSRKPLVAIGGIGFDAISEVFAAGADSVAVIGALSEGDLGFEENARRLLRKAG